MTRVLIRTLALCLLLFGTAAHADPFNLPGLSQESNAYARSLTARVPAGGNPQLRHAADQEADAAIRRQDWVAAAAALETRISLGQAAADQWLALAQAQLHRTPSDTGTLRHALDAAWQVYIRSPDDRVQSLLLMADALQRLDRPAQAITALEAAADTAPDDASIRQRLQQARQQAGLLVQKVRTEPETDPPRACLGFTSPPRRSADFHPQDWVTLDPPVAGAAVTSEGDQICISGLPSGATTKVTLRAGMPGEGGLSLKQADTLSIAMANRNPRIDFDTRLFVLPKGQAPAIGVSTVNLSDLKLTLSRLSERNVVAFLRDSRLGQPVDSWDAQRIGEQTGRVVWQGKAAIPQWEPNKTVHTALPLPDAMASAGPGLYALIAEPGDGTHQASTAVQMILRTDLAPTVWRGTDGLTLQVRGFADAEPRAGVKLRLLAENNDILAETTTDADGIGRFAAPLLHGDGPLAPRAVHLFGPNDDFTMLDLNSAAFDLSDRGVSGLPQPGPLDAFVWLDRGIYRPGETVQVMALLRDDAGRPANLPVHVIVRRPNGQVFLDATPPRLADAAVHLPVALSNGSQAGSWTVEIKADPKAAPIGSASFRVDAFVPDRMAVDIAPADKPIVPGRPFSLPIAARYLYGAPAAGLTGKATIRLVVDPAPFPALAGYRIGLEDEVYAPDAQEQDLPETDAQGHTTLDIDIKRAPDVTHALKAAIDAVVNDPSGHGSRASAEVPVRPGGNLIGIKPGFAGAAIDADSEAAFDIAAVNPDGKRIALKATLRLVRENPDWRLVMHGSLARYEVVWKDQPLRTIDVTIPADKPYRFTDKLPFGRYRVEVLETGGLAATSMRFRAGWVASENPDVPDQVDVSADRKSYEPGATARVHIAAPFGGPATLLVLTDKVQSLRDITVPAGGMDVDVPVDPGWGPGAYVTVHVFRPAADAKSRPARAIGLTWIGIDPAARKLPLTFDVPDKFPPRAKASVRVRTAPGAWVSLAAVDEGILRLTSFVSPDPSDHFLGRRRLGIDIRDDWGRLIKPPEGEATVLRQGGDEGSFALPDIPQKTVTLFVPPVQANADGVAEIPLDFPDFNGQVRLMAVAWSGTKLAAAAQDVLVRDPEVAEVLLPRFLAPGDQARVTVLLHNLDLPGGATTATITTDGPLQVTGNADLTATLAPGQQALPSTMLTATGAGRGVVHLHVAGPGGFQVDRQAAITIRPARAAITLVSGTELAPKAEAPLAVPADRFLPGTWRATASFGGAVRYDVTGIMQDLQDYRFNCLEQATSRGFPLALLGGSVAAGTDRAGRLQQAVDMVLDRQRYDGGFGLWSANGDAQPWLSVYATDFLQRARAAGAAVPEQALKDAIKFVADAADSPGDGAQEQATQPYRLYVLARAGQGRPGAARVLAEGLNKLPTPLAKAQLGAALALAHDPKRAQVAFIAALDAPERRSWMGDYGSAMRDQAAIALLLKESGLLPDRLATLLTRMPGPDLQPQSLNTQEEAWLASAAAVLGNGLPPASISLNGQGTITAQRITVSLRGPGTVRNLGAQPVWAGVSITGVPATPLPAARSQMRISRQFFSLDGQPLDLDHLKQNTVFILLLEGRAEDGQPHTALIQHGLPAGWEIAGRFTAGGAVPGLSWLGELTETQAQPAADDRFAAVVALSEAAPNFRVAVRLRAVTPGTYELPGAEVADMYRPGVFARQNVGRITVQSAE